MTGFDIANNLSQLLFEAYLCGVFAVLFIVVNPSRVILRQGQQPSKVSGVSLLFFLLECRRLAKLKIFKVSQVVLAFTTLAASIFFRDRSFWREFMSSLAAGRITRRNSGLPSFKITNRGSARSTATGAVPGADVQIVTAKRMPTMAVSLPSIYTRLAIGSRYYVDVMRDRLKMNRANTESIPAKVVAFSTRNDVPNEHAISDGMGSPLRSSIAEHPIAFVVPSSRPDPARSFFVKVRGRDFEFREETVKKFAVNKNFIKMGLSHCGFTSHVKFQLVRLGDALVARLRAVFILPRFVAIAR